MDSFFESCPDSFFEIRVEKLDISPALIGLCVGYEQGEWRYKQFANHALEWIPEFALDYSEREQLKTSTSVYLLRKAASRIYETKKFRRRGEFGELFLHIAIRQAFHTLPAISKIYYKDKPNVTVKGFDAVHVVVGDDDLELWIGETKFYKNIDSAITSVLKEIDEHTKRDYLREEFSVIIDKLDKNWPHYNRLEKLLNRNTSLDEIFTCTRIPVLLTYESPTVNDFSSVSDKYMAAIKKEIEKHYGTFVDKNKSKLIINLFLLPLKDKKKLIEELDRGLKAWQKI